MAGSRHKRLTSLDLIPTLTPALALDPFTGDLLLCNGNTGDILRCNVSVTPPSCEVEVLRATLESMTPGDVGELTEEFFVEALCRGSLLKVATSQ